VTAAIDPVTEALVFSETSDPFLRTGTLDLADAGRAVSAGSAASRQCWAVVSRLPR
jgi:hypothetical protein